LTELSANIQNIVNRNSQLEQELNNLQTTHNTQENNYRLLEKEKNQLQTDLTNIRNELNIRVGERDNTRAERDARPTIQQLADMTRERNYRPNMSVDDYNMEKQNATNALNAMRVERDSFDKRPNISITETQ
jgi:chromosome segregation ATPase